VAPLFTAAQRWKHFQEQKCIPRFTELCIGFASKRSTVSTGLLRVTRYEYQCFTSKKLSGYLAIVFNRFQRDLWKSAFSQWTHTRKQTQGLAPPPASNPCVRLPPGREAWQPFPPARLEFRLKRGTLWLGLVGPELDQFAPQLCRSVDLRDDYGFEVPAVSVRVLRILELLHPIFRGEV